MSRQDAISLCFVIAVVALLAYAWTDPEPLPTLEYKLDQVVERLDALENCVRYRPGTLSVDKQIGTECK